MNGRRWLVVAGGLTLGMSLPTLAQASTAGVFHEDVGDDQYVSYEAGPRERNDLEITYPAARSIRIVDAAGISPQDGCVAEGPNVVRCQVSNRPGSVYDLGDGDDRIRVAGTAPVGIVVMDGRGDDVVRGGGRDDEFDNGPGRDRIYGRGGDDELHSGTGPDLLSGGAGIDIASYWPDDDRTHGVHADLQGDADDGARGERDRIGRDVENLQGTEEADVLRGNGRANVIQGYGGRDRIFGGAGDDTIGESPFGDDEVIFPGRGRDNVWAGRIVHARDGERDTIAECGTAIADRSDRVRGCKRVRR